MSRISQNGEILLKTHYFVKRANNVVSWTMISTVRGTAIVEIYVLNVTADVSSKGWMSVNVFSGSSRPRASSLGNTHQRKLCDITRCMCVLQDGIQDVEVVIFIESAYFGEKRS